MHRHAKRPPLPLRTSPNRSNPRIARCGLRRGARMSRRCPVVGRRRRFAIARTRAIRLQASKCTVLQVWRMTTEQGRRRPSRRGGSSSFRDKLCPLAVFELLCTRRRAWRQIAARCVSLECFGSFSTVTTCVCVCVCEALFVCLCHTFCVGVLCVVCLYVFVVCCVWCVCVCVCVSV